MSISLIITGTTGMVGHNVLQEALADPDVSRVLSLTRRPIEGVSHPKLRQMVVSDFFNLSAQAAELGAYDACLHCLGVSSVGMKEADYARVTYDLTMHLAQTLLRQNPAVSFCYVSGQSTDGTEQGSSMWARVKGRTENALLAMPFRHVHMFRPGFIKNDYKAPSMTLLYRVLYVFITPLYPLLNRFGMATTGGRLGRAMIRAARDGYAKPVLENPDINALGA